MTNILVIGYSYHLIPWSYNIKTSHCSLISFDIQSFFVCSQFPFPLKLSRCKDAIILQFELKIEAIQKILLQSMHPI